MTTIIGVLYRAKGQNEDNELYQNVDGSPQFQKFLELLGDRVKLLGWESSFCFVLFCFVCF